jgi:hypothetical protein
VIAHTQLETRNAQPAERNRHCSPGLKKFP